MHIPRNISIMTVFWRQNKPLQYVQKKLHKTSKCLSPVHIDMYVGKWKAFFWRFHKSFSEIHWSILRKIAIDLLYFWDVYDVNLWEKKLGQKYGLQSRSNTHFKAEAGIGRRFSKIVCNVAFFALFKARRNACDIFHFSSLFISSCSLLFY